jgi:hypothetical protein
MALLATCLDGKSGASRITTASGSSQDSFFRPGSVFARNRRYPISIKSGSISSGAPSPSTSVLLRRVDTAWRNL